MDALRQMAVKGGKKLGEKNIATFHKLFLSEVEKNGRVHEMSLIGRLKMATMNLFADIPMGMSMFVKGKLPLAPTKIKGVDEVRKLFYSRRSAK
jgi:heterodisulfide reductase subunit C